MRRTLLIAACSLFLAGTQAFAADQQKWSKSVENTVSKWEELNLQAPTAVDNAGNTYATGAFTQPIVIGSVVLDPIANSAYLAKYNAEGNVAWAVGLRGAATITAITTDEQNNVYVAGTLADAVEVGSTDGKNANHQRQGRRSGKPSVQFHCGIQCRRCIESYKSHLVGSQCRNSFQRALLPPSRISIYKNQPHRSKQRKVVRFSHAYRRRNHRQCTMEGHIHEYI